MQLPTEGMKPSEAKARYGATHYQTMRDGVTPQMYYKLETIQVNDGTRRKCWVYLSFCNLWQGSNIKVGSPEESRLKPITDTEEGE